MAGSAEPHRWTIEEESNLIQFYKDHAELWDHTKRDHISEDEKEHLFTTYLEENGTKGLTVKEARKKILNLKTTFWRELRKMDNFRKSGTGIGAHFKSRWVHFDELKFLEPSMKAAVSSESLSTLSPWNSDASGDEEGHSSSDSSSSSSFPLPVSEVPRSTKKNVQNEAKSEKSLKRAIKALQSLQEVDGVQSFLNSLADSLRSLPSIELERCKLQLQAVVLEYIEKTNKGM